MGVQELAKDYGVSKIGVQFEEEGLPLQMQEVSLPLALSWALEVGARKRMNTGDYHLTLYNCWEKDVNLCDVYKGKYIS